MCDDFLMTLYSPLDSLTGDDYDALMAEMADDPKPDPDDEGN